MHFTILGIGLIAVLTVVNAIVYLTLLTSPRRHRFEQEFCQAYRFSPHQGTYNNSEMLLVTGKLEETARELAAARDNLQHYRQTPRRESLQGAMFKGMLVDEASKSVKKMERTYRRLRKLAHRAGYSWQLLDELHERILDTADDTPALTATS